MPRAARRFSPSRARSRRCPKSRGVRCSCCSSPPKTRIAGSKYYSLHRASRPGRSPRTSTTTAAITRTHEGHHADRLRQVVARRIARSIVEKQGRVLVPDQCPTGLFLRSDQFNSRRSACPPCISTMAPTTRQAGAGETQQSEEWRRHVYPPAQRRDRRHVGVRRHDRKTRCRFRGGVDRRAGGCDADVESGDEFEAARRKALAVDRSAKWGHSHFLAKGDSPYAIAGRSLRTSNIHQRQQRFFRARVAQLGTLRDETLEEPLVLRQRRGSDGIGAFCASRTSHQRAAAYSAAGEQLEHSRRRCKVGAFVRRAPSAAPAIDSRGADHDAGQRLRDRVRVTRALAEVHQRDRAVRHETSRWRAEIAVDDSRAVARTSAPRASIPR